MALQQLWGVHDSTYGAWVRPLEAQDRFPCGSLVLLVGPSEQWIGAVFEWEGPRNRFKEFLFDPSQKNGFGLKDLHRDR